MSVWEWLGITIFIAIVLNIPKWAILPFIFCGLLVVLAYWWVTLHWTDRGRKKMLDRWEHHDP